jgi:hypothetical protein
MLGVFKKMILVVFLNILSLQFRSFVTVYLGCLVIPLQTN